MKKSYIIFWLSIALAIIAVLIGGVLYLKHELKPLQSVTQKATQIAKIRDVIHKAITQPDKLNEKDTKSVIAELTPEPAKSLLGKPTNKDSTKIPTRITTINIDTDFHKTNFRTTTTWQIKKTSLYLGLNLGIPIYDNDTIPNQKQIKVGPTILLYW